MTAMALAVPAQQATAQAETATTGEGVPGLAPLGNAVPTQPEPVPPKRSPAHYLWAVLIARIYEVFPLLCPMCGGQMRLIAFITHSANIRQILDHIGVDSEPPHISPARGPPLWDDFDAQVDDGAQIEPDWDLAAQPAPDDEWTSASTGEGCKAAIQTHCGVGPRVWLGLKVLKPLRGAVKRQAWRLTVTSLQRRPGATVVQVVSLTLGLMALLLLTVVRGDLMTAWRNATPPDAPNRFIINIQPDQTDPITAGARVSEFDGGRRGRRAAPGAGGAGPGDHGGGIPVRLHADIRRAGAVCGADGLAG